MNSAEIAQEGASSALYAKWCFASCVLNRLKPIRFYDRIVKI